MKLMLIAIFLLGGLFFFSVGTIGLLRFPDLFTRAHSAAKCDTLGAVLCLIALMMHSGINYSSVKLLLVLIFLWVTNPTATHLIVKAVFVKKDKHKKIDGVR
ncbi:MAG: multicomponent Na+:H+ antiporter subunit [Clostridiales bacterium]|jgi:multicomponent Na+:H+ antiporter subunit G|nr:multicomponent Na+:H+ antiporter subunit [Clostridiales bacterium]MDK2933914.1 multicomponent Na+:H+ antiporter subunit [Clostridiales bacterium]